MQHVYWVIEGLLAGRKGPMLAPWDLAELRVGGLRVIVSLSEEVDPDRIAAAGLRLYRYAIPPVLIFTSEQQEDLLEGVEAALPVIQREVTGGWPVLVHCHEGKDRTGAMLACYLIRYRGHTADRAIECVRERRPDAMSAPGYEEAVREFGRRERSATATSR
jgi:hypothetical protein